MIEKVPFKSWHGIMILNSGDKWSPDGDPSSYFKPSVLRHLEGQFSWTTLADGVPVACGGVMTIFPRHFSAWVFLDIAKSRRHMLVITRHVKWGLDQLHDCRVSASTPVDFAEGRRWLEMLGFVVETPFLEKFGPNGADHVGYKLIKD